MKVFFINTVCGTGSTGNIVTQLLMMLRQDGHSAMAAYGVGPGKRLEPGEGYPIVTRGQYYLHNALSRLTDHEGLYSTSQTRSLVEKIREFDPDVIHLHNLHGHYVNYEVLFDYLSKANKPVVWTLHDCWSMTGHCAHFAAAGCEQWKQQCLRCDQLHHYPQCVGPGDVKRNHQRKKAAFTGIPKLTIATPSHWMAEVTAQSYLKDYPVRVIHNGIDLSVFQPTEGDFRKKYGCEDAFLLLGVSFEWTYVKGLDVFIELAKRLDDRYRIVLVGTNEKLDRELPDNIISIHRTQNQKALAEIYTAADLFVNPTREEVLGLVNVEALACGTPVVTFRSGGSPECIDETCGIAVETDDTDSLLNVIHHIRENRPFSPEACRKRAEAFDANARFREYIRLYEEVTSHESPAELAYDSKTDTT